MSKRDDALAILRSLGMPKQQLNERSSLTLLALAGLSQRDAWSACQRPLLRVWDIMAWMKAKYGKEYAPNSRETIRRQTIHQFEQARLIDRNPDDPQRPTNSGETRYQLTRDATSVLKSYGTGRFERLCASFLQRHGSLTTSYRRSRELVRVHVTLASGRKIALSPGAHNELQRQVIEEFAPRFAHGAVVVYMGDTAKKRLIIAEDVLQRIHVPEFSHDKLPDVVLFDESRNWLYLIEAVTSHGPVSPKRHAELERMLGGCEAGRVYVTAFADFSSFRRHVAEVVWESEVWIAEYPDHLIHFNGGRFLGPYPQKPPRV